MSDLFTKGEIHLRYRSSSKLIKEKLFTRKCNYDISVKASLNLAWRPVIKFDPTPLVRPAS